MPEAGVPICCGGECAKQIAHSFLLHCTMLHALGNLHRGKIRQNFCPPPGVVFLHKSQVPSARHSMGYPVDGE